MNVCEDGQSLLVYQRQTNELKYILWDIQIYSELWMALCQKSFTSVLVTENIDGLENYPDENVNLTKAIYLYLIC